MIWDKMMDIIFKEWQIENRNRKIAGIKRISFAKFINKS
jgi:hypothetical protein